MIALLTGWVERYVCWIGACVVPSDDRALLAVLPPRYHAVGMEGEWFAW
jgi:hypothetical protein